MFLKRSILCLGLVVATGLSLSLLGEPPAGDRDVQQLINRLGSKKFKVREEAERQLLEREDAAPALQRVLQMPGADPEVARRATQILAEFQQREARRALKTLQTLGEQGEVDLFVERFVRRHQWDPPDSAWQVLGELAQKLAQLEAQGPRKANLPRSPHILFSDFRQYYALVQPKTLEFAQRRLRPCLVRGEEVGVKVLAGSLVATSGNFRAIELLGSAIFAGGSVTVADMASCIIVCDGEFKASTVFDCIVIARGPVQCHGVIRNSLIVSVGSVRVPKGTTVEDTVIKEKEPNPLGFVKFFDPAREGITVEKAEGGLRVKTATEGKRFARAGLRAGDVVTAIDGEAVKDTELFRRLLRRKLAEEKDAVFKVRRGEKTLEVSVRFKD